MEDNGRRIWARRGTRLHHRLARHFDKRWYHHLARHLDKRWYHHLARHLDKRRRRVIRRGRGLVRSSGLSHLGLPCGQVGRSVSRTTVTDVGIQQSPSGFRWRRTQYPAFFHTELEFLKTVGSAQRE